MHCPVCLEKESIVFSGAPEDLEYFNVRSEPVAIMRCVTCESLFQNPWPSADEVHGFYGPDYQNYVTTSVPLLAQVNESYQRLGGRQFLNKYGQAAKVLDFGCGQGGFLRTLRQAGCTGLAGFDFVLYDELNAIPGVRFFNDLEAIRSSGLRFDIIRMRHVIEHLTETDEVMRKLACLLTPGGRIIGQTPNAAHYTSRLMGRFWGSLHYPYHTQIFSPRGLSMAASRWGLRLATTSGAILPTGWTMSWENMLKKASGSRRRGRSSAYIVLLALGTPLAMVDRLMSPKATANFDFELERLAGT